MNIVVCVKQIPDPANPSELDPHNHFLVRPEEQVMYDGDRYGVEMALQLAEASEEIFATTVESSSFRGILELATPYTRLQELTIGSRPARRGDGGLENLRAIPWVLCWTQTRLLLHAWLGAGRAWRERRDEPDAKKLHALVDERVDEMRALAHQAVDSAIELHGVLTPEQRAEIAKRVEERMAEHDE